MKRYERFSEDDLAKFLSRQVNAERRLTFEKRIRHGVTKEEMKFAEERIGEVLDEINLALENVSWLNGEDLSLADISVAPFIERLEANDLDELTDWKLRPNLGDWWSRVQNLPSYKKAFDFTTPD